MQLATDPLFRAACVKMPGRAQLPSSVYGEDDPWWEADAEGPDAWQNMLFLFQT